MFLSKVLFQAASMNKIFDKHLTPRVIIRNSIVLSISQKFLFSWTISLNVSVPLTNVHDHPLFPWLWPPVSRAGLSLPDIWPHPWPEAAAAARLVSLSISPLSPTLASSSLTNWAESASRSNAGVGPVHCMRAKATPLPVFYARIIFRGGWGFFYQGVQWQH